MHFVLPFVAFMLLGLDLRRALPIAVLGIVPDLDVLFLVHRSVSHSVIVIGLVTFPFFMYSWKFKPEWLSTTWLCFLALSSNPILDLFFGFVPVFWPLYPFSIWLKVGLDVRLGSDFILIPFLNFVQVPTVFNRRNLIEGGLFTSESVIITIILMTPIIYRLLRKFLKEE